MTITEFLKRESQIAPYPGACCRMADKWVILQTGFSPLRRFGRDFETDSDVEAWLAEPGSIAVAVNRVMRSCGFAKTKAPGQGDVGLVIHKQRLCMAIHAGREWISRDDDGFISVPLAHVWKAWRISLEG